jgi:3-phenylpropionate/cinnamic acid dioxygenase small subunit
MGLLGRGAVAVGIRRPLPQAADSSLLEPRDPPSSPTIFGRHDRYGDALYRHRRIEKRLRPEQGHHELLCRLPVRNRPPSLGGNQLADREAIRDVIGRFAHLADEKRYEELGEFFTEDAAQTTIINGREKHGPFIGRQAIIGRLAGVGHLQPQQRHIVTNIVFEEETPSSATVVSYLTLVHITDAGPRIQSTGKYRDSFTLRDGAWRIQEKLIMLDSNFRD